MDDTVKLTCVSCGRSEQVPNAPEVVRNHRCPECGSPMVEKRRPGDVSRMPLPRAQ
jgi:DNA-directed RNA polymerase subunit RPC12/RpoP